MEDNLTLNREYDVLNETLTVTLTETQVLDMIVRLQNQSKPNQSKPNQLNDIQNEFIKICLDEFKDMNIIESIIEMHPGPRVVVKLKY